MHTVFDKEAVLLRCSDHHGKNCLGNLWFDQRLRKSLHLCILQHFIRCVIN